jgi:hypothetical protein
MSFNNECSGPAELQSVRVFPSLSVFPPTPLTCQEEILPGVPVVTSDSMTTVLSAIAWLLALNLAPDLGSAPMKWTRMYKRALSRSQHKALCRQCSNTYDLSTPHRIGQELLRATSRRS